MLIPKEVNFFDINPVATFIVCNLTLGGVRKQPPIWDKKPLCFFVYRSARAQPQLDGNR